MSTLRSRRRKETAAALVEEKKKEVKLGLHERLEESDLVKIHEAFSETPGGHMEKKQLQDLLHDIAKITYDDAEFEIVFMKINTNCDGFATWNEFISYLILGFEEQEVSMEYQSLEPPISGIPRVMRSNHRHPVNCITYCPTVKPDRTYGWNDGSILTCSKDGVINYWSLDLQLERTVQSTCPELKVQQTWVLDMVVLPDVSVVCTSSTERDLRFYDTSARKFELRVMFTSMEDAVCCMYYRFSQDATTSSKLIIGDMGGSVRIIKFSPIGRGPFKSQPGVPLLHVRWERLIKGHVSGFSVIEFKHIHSDWVRQVSYYPSLHCFVSCSSCHRTPLIVKDLGENRCQYIYKVPKGVWCFAILDTLHLMATGSPDCLVRIWNPFVPDRPSVIFVGHHAGVVALVLQESGKILASMAKDKCIKVWDLPSQTCLQTYLEMPAEIGERTDITLLYNPESREIILGSVMIVVIHLCKLQNGEHTDGNTHSNGVSVILYNTLFQVLITCGLDSYIIVWDPWNGRRMRVIKEAHTRLLHGEIIPVEITSATFDPGQQYLLTGAHDGSLKLWNFNAGMCLRNMNIERGAEICSLFWVKKRMIAVGWNRHVTEFAASGEVVGPGGSFSKPWDTRHTEDVLSAAVRLPQSLATSSYNGELLLWRLETGQPYKQYNVANPTTRIKIQYKPTKTQRQSVIHDPATFPDVNPSGGARRRSRIQSVFTKRQSITTKTTIPSAVNSQPVLSGPTPRSRRVSMVAMPEKSIPLRGLAVHSMIFLCTRPMHPQIGTLFVAIENGTIQVWSHHASGGFITSFSAIHKAGDYVVSMASDKDNEFLFTGTTAGYIKTWIMKYYCEPQDDGEPICMPKYRLIFPFLWRDIFVGRAKRVCRGQPKPLLVNSYKGHLHSVAGMVYLDKAKILITCSSDFSARMWTLGGRYLQTIGTFKPWKNIEVDVPPPENFEFTIPPDVKRVASSTTLKVLMGGNVPRRLTKKQEQQKAKKELIDTDTIKGIYGKRLEDPILGNYYKLPKRTTQRHDFELDTSFAYIPVYEHLIMPPPVEVAPPEITCLSSMVKAEGSKKISDRRNSYQSLNTLKSKRSRTSSISSRVSFGIRKQVEREHKPTPP